MGKRSLAQSCVLYEVTLGKGFSNSEAGGNFDIMRICMGKRSLDHIAIFVIGVCLPSQLAPKKHNQERKKATNLRASREFLKKCASHV